MKLNKINRLKRNFLTLLFTENKAGSSSFKTPSKNNFSKWHSSVSEKTLEVEKKRKMQISHNVTLGTGIWKLHT